MINSKNRYEGQHWFQYAYGELCDHGTIRIWNFAKLQFELLPEIYALGAELCMCDGPISGELLL
jgi:hypothetical protein